jgi:hypothetical protein
MHAWPFQFFLTRYFFVLIEIHSLYNLLLFVGMVIMCLVFLCYFLFIVCIHLPHIKTETGVKTPLYVYNVYSFWSSQTDLVWNWEIFYVLVPPCGFIKVSAKISLSKKLYITTKWDSIVLLYHLLKIIYFSQCVLIKTIASCYPCQDFYRPWLYMGCLIISGDCWPFASIWVNPRFYFWCDPYWSF